jgi:hypothetical protein
MKTACSGATLMRLRITYTNCPTVRSAGTKYLALSMSGMADLSAFSTMTGMRSGYLSRMRAASAWRFSVGGVYVVCVVCVCVCVCVCVLWGGMARLQRQQVPPEAPLGSLGVPLWRISRGQKPLSPKSGSCTPPARWPGRAGRHRGQIRHTGQAKPGCEARGGAGREKGAGPRSAAWAAAVFFFF